MGKLCLNKLSGNILQRCTITPVGIKDIYLMYAEEVTLSYSNLADMVSDVAFAAGARSYKVEGYKQNIQITSSLRALDASSKLDVSVTFKILQTDRVMWRNMLSGRFYVMAIPNDKSARPAFIGVTSPLEVTSSDFDSNAGAGLVTITLGAPEGSAGNYILDTADAARDTIISKAV